MGLLFSGPIKTDAETQTEDKDVGVQKKRNFMLAARLASSNALNRRMSVAALQAPVISEPTKPEFPEEILRYKYEDIEEMIALFKEKKASIDRSSIRGVRSKKDLYDKLSKNSPEKINKTSPVNLNMHRQNHPKGYLTKTTKDYHAQFDEELSVQKGTMVKVLRNHCDGRYEVYSAGGFGLVPGKILAYVQYEPDAEP